MKKKIIVFGAGYYGNAAYYKLKEQFEIIYYVDNNTKILGTYRNGISVISSEKLNEIFDKENMDIIICSQAYFSISNQLLEMGIGDYYVMLEGFLYHCNRNEMMMPVELKNVEYFRKKEDEKNILFVQNAVCVRTHKIASLMRKYGYKVYLLYSMAPPEYSNGDFGEIYSGVYTFYTQNAIIDFVEQSEFDIIHSSNEPDMLTAILVQSSKTIIHDCHDLSSAYKSMTLEELELEFIANRESDGVIYTTDGIREEAVRKFQISRDKTFILENMISEELTPDSKYEKLSKMDGEMHCVYEGGVFLEDSENHRYFVNIWKKIAVCGVHIHFYSICKEEDWKTLEELDPHIHYEGNLSSLQLAVEMSKYDVGICILNVTDKNQQYLEYASPNKIHEYINAGIPVVVGDIKSQQEFVEKNEFGRRIDMSGDILKQLQDVSKMEIKDNILHDLGLTLESKIPELIKFYKKCMGDMQ